MTSRSTTVRVAGPPLVAILTLIMLWSGAAARFDLPVRDMLLDHTPAQGPLASTVVAIDDASLERLGPWPWPRSLLGALISTVHSAKPEGIVVDILLTDATPQDRALAAALEQSETVLAAALSDERRWLYPTEILMRHTRIGHASLDLDHDGVMRRVTSTRQAGVESVPALSVVAASLYDPFRTIPVARRLSPDFSTPPELIPTVSAASVLDGSMNLDVLENRLVFIGITALGLGDRVMTPVSDAIPVPGVLVHASIAESIIQDHLINQVPPWMSALSAALLAALALHITRLGGWSRIGASVSVIAVPAIAGFLLLRFAAIEIPIATLTFFPAFAVLGVEIHTAFSTSIDAARTESILTGAARKKSTSRSPEARMANLLAVAETIGREREEEWQSRKALAHELKTPLTSVRGLAQLLSGFELSAEERARVADMMMRETTRLQSLIEQLFDIERIQLARFDEEAQQTDLSELVSNRVEILAQSASHVITTSIEPGLEVLGRPDLLNLVIDNLVGNAMKYSPEGSPVQIRLTRQAAGRIALEIEDAGAGVAETERQRIFTRFARGSSATGTQGLGLGLALVKEVTSWHRGTVDVIPARFRGSIFRVELPERAQVRAENAS